MSKIDIKSLLDHYNIPFTLGPRKNVGADIIGVNCPFCGESSFHLGIFSSGYFSCWVCGKRGHIYHLIKEYTGTHPKDFKIIIKRYNQRPRIQDSIVNTVKNLLNRIKPDVKIENVIHPLPKEALSIDNIDRFPELRKWLLFRHINLNVCKKYGAKYIHSPSSKYSKRLIIPIYEYKQSYPPVGWQGIDVTKISRNKYISPKGFNLKSHLYGINWISYKQKYIILVEGILDVWRVENAIASFGKDLSDRQRKIIYDNTNELIIAWDSDAIINAKKEANWWKGVGKKVRIIQFPEGHDPDSFILEYGMEEWQKLIKQ